MSKPDPVLAAKGETFAALHAAPGAFVIANAWDPGSARLLAALGFQALATTSAGYARSIGVTDYKAGRDNVMAHAAAMAPAVAIPVSGDLENGFGHAPEACAETILMAAKAGLVGGSIEDATGDSDDPIYDLVKAKERVAAAVEAARSLPLKFMLTARAENFLHARPDLKDTIARLQAYQDAGADVLFAPLLPSADAIRSVVAETDRPLNVLISPRDSLLSVQQLADLGVKRVSVGGALTSAALTGLINAARDLASGSMEWTRSIIPSKEIDALLTAGAG
jgi:2-methylisocitrate lyase-like PEP mutase family enzyme